MNNVEKIKQEAQNLRDNLHNEPASIDFEQELYKAFGQVKDFTLGMRIAKWFYDMGKNSQEPVNEELEKEVDEYILDNFDDAEGRVYVLQCARHFAEWQKKQMMKDAIEGTICISAPEHLVVRAEVKEEDGFKFADRVKIIVIKED